MDGKQQQMEALNTIFEWICDAASSPPSTEYSLWQPVYDRESIPMFEFTPTQKLQSSVSNDAIFTIRNQLELLQQLRGLMIDSLVIDVYSKKQRIAVLYLRFDTAEFSNKGCVPCYHDQDGVCGYLQNCKVL